MKRIVYVFFVFYILTITPVFGMEPPPIKLHLEIKQIKEARQPYFIDNNCIITYKGDHPIRYVGAAFEHEQFSTIHPFIKNDFDIFILIFPIEVNSEIEELKYRLVVDGLWIADPVNKNYVQDVNGIKLSKISVPDKLSSITDTPIVKQNGTVQFVYQGPRDRNVYVVGTFNNWDPFMHKMPETSPGYYELNVRLLPGDHFYYFLSNGLKVLDPLNSDRGTDYEGEEASHFMFTPEEPVALD